MSDEPKGAPMVKVGGRLWFKNSRGVWFHSSCSGAYLDEATTGESAMLDALAEAEKDRELTEWAKANWSEPTCESDGPHYLWRTERQINSGTSTAYMDETEVWQMDPSGCMEPVERTALARLLVAHRAALGTARPEAPDD